MLLLYLVFSFSFPFKICLEFTLALTWYAVYYGVLLSSMPDALKAVQVKNQF